ncbi:MAG: NAD(P)-dependent oxidoreductase [Clostridia bacterium]|nr:NAD(P)-dependent oxidoreductase [Clostridia bacterium]
MKNVIVTGGTGFLGRNLIRRLCADNYHIYAVVRPESVNTDLLPKHENVTPVRCSLADLPARADLFPADCDCFFHFAWGGVNREQINSEEIHSRSREDSLAAVQFALDHGVKCFIDAGSRSEYGAEKQMFREDLECHPLVAYGRNKLKFYQQAHAMCKGSGMRFIHARIFSVYGVDDHPWSLIYTAVSKMMRNQEMELSHCTQMWNFMDVRDTSDLFMTFFEKRDMIPGNDNGIFNVATDDTRPLREFVEEIHRITNSTSELKFGAFRQGADSAMSILPDMTKVEKTFGWKARISFSEGIRHLVEQMGEENHA